MQIIGHMQVQPPTPKTVEQMRGGFLRAMSDAGLKPTVVYHNLTPSELYEKVRVSLHCNGNTMLHLSTHKAQHNLRLSTAVKKFQLCGLYWSSNRGWSALASHVSSYRCLDRVDLYFSNWAEQSKATQQAASIAVSAKRAFCPKLVGPKGHIWKLLIKK